MGCKKPVHSICADNVGEEGYRTQILCRRCVVNRKRANDRDMADEGQSQQAEKMCQKSSLTLPKLEIGDNVRLQIPKVDSRTSRSKKSYCYCFRGSEGWLISNRN